MKKSMKKQLLPCFLAGLIFMGGGSALAEPQLTAPMLSEREVIQRIATHNPMLLGAQEAVLAARAEQKELESALWPVLGVSSQFTAGNVQHMSMPVPDVPAASMSMRPQGLTANLNATVMYPVFTGGKIQAQIEGARQRVQQAQTDYIQQLVLLRTDALLAFLNIRWQRARRGVLIAERDTQEENLKLIQKRFALGKEAHYNVLRAQAERDNIQQSLNKAELEMTQQSIELRRLAALPTEIGLASPEPLSDPFIAPGAFKSPFELQQIKQQITDRSPPLNLLKARILEAETRVRISQSRYMPFIYLVGVYEQRLPEIEMMQYTSGAAVDLLISLPVFDGFNRDAESDRLRREVAVLRYRYTDAQSRIHAEADKLLSGLQIAQQNIKLSASAVAQSQAEYTLTKQRYDRGKIVLLELLESSRFQQQARLNQIENWFIYETARIRLEGLFATQDLALTT